MFLFQFASSNLATSTPVLVVSSENSQEVFVFGNNQQSSAQQNAQAQVSITS